ncbi:MAG: ATP-binding cassette, subfamily multidrug efflux pump, partial [Actinomycetota bacterium]|nr:ATP-binding cassette, subfamily multidrug efflux pump [Actinomycetota bacterium]
MSDTQKPTAPARPVGPPGGIRRGPGGGGGPFGGMGMPVEKSLNFGPSAKRLLGRLAPERIAVTGVIVLGIISVALNVVGPKILGNATTL